MTDGYNLYWFATVLTGVDNVLINCVVWVLAAGFTWSAPTNPHATKPVKASLRMIGFRIFASPPRHTYDVKAIISGFLGGFNNENITIQPTATQFFNS
jgi:hypothetical protein